MLSALKEFFSKLLGGQPKEKPQSEPHELQQKAAASGLQDQFYNSEYYRKTGLDFRDAVFNTGNHGEMLTFIELTRNPAIQYLFPNVYITLANQGTTEIDIVLLSNHYIYVIENKNFSGTIYGKLEEKNWVQFLGGKSFPFYNPVLQNNGHIKGLLELFPSLSSDRIIPLVVFSNRCKLKIEAIDEVMKREEVNERISKLEESATKSFTSKEIDRFVTALSERIKQDEQTKQKHIEYVQTVKAAHSQNRSKS